MFATRTGGFPIGFRRGWSDWQKDLDGVSSWAKSNGFGVIDTGGDTDKIGAKVVQSGLKIGTADALDWKNLIHPDKAKRQESVAKNVAYAKTCVEFGAKNFFIVMLPEKPELPRKENFGYLVESMKELAPQFDKIGARLAIEGWPGPGALCCTPEGYRALIKEVNSKSIGINYDPSHLLRMGIDPIRFVEEFGEHVVHVHGKDTEIVAEGLYEYGYEQPATFGKSFGFGGMSWRYTIPGHGVMRWTKAFQILKDKGYKGAVCIELEDQYFNGKNETEQQGILAGGQYLASC